MDAETRRKVIAAFDSAHAAAPKGKELDYVESVETWIKVLVEEPSEALLLAAHCQHFERWVINRDTYPMDRPGYLKWRIDVATRQGERVNEIMTELGCDTELTERTSLLAGKKIPRSDADAQAMEDAACLVFIEEQAADFAPKYIEKMIPIIQKTWAKMSDHAHELALQLNLPPEVTALVTEALGE